LRGSFQSVIPLPLGGAEGEQLVADDGPPGGEAEGVLVEARLEGPVRGYLRSWPSIAFKPEPE
jgi:hypothetical protein